MEFFNGLKYTGVQILDEKMKLLPIYFHSVGHYPNHGHTFRPHGFGLYQISLCISGKGTFVADDKEYDIKEGDIFFFNPSVSHEYFPIDKDWTVLWVVFDGANAENIVKYFDLGEYSVKRTDDDAYKKLRQMYESLYDIYIVTGKYEFELTMTVFRMLEEISKCENIICRNKEADKIDRRGFNPAVSFIKDHYMEFLTLDDIVKQCNLSKNHFTRLFKKEYGVTPMVYLNRYRVSVAKFVLATTIETVDEIAIKAGFSNTSYFCAVFKKFEGCTPTVYRERHKG